MTAPTPHRAALLKVYDDFPLPEWPLVDEAVRRYLAAMEAAGWRMVPREPTREQKDAALKAMTNPTVQNPKAAAWDAIFAYRAMYDAAPPPDA